MSMLEFEQQCSRVRNYFEVAKLIEDLEEDVYEALINLEDMILKDEVDEDDFEAIVATVAEAIAPTSH